MFAPAKQRTSPNWPLRQCCGCIPNPAGMIILGILGILAFLNALQLNNPNRKAMMENLCKDSDVAGSLKAIGAVGLIQIIAQVIGGIVMLWVGIIGCQLQGVTQGAIPEGGCCGRNTGVSVGTCAVGCSLFGGFLGIIGAIIWMATAENLALATCCNILAYDIHESDLTPTILGWKPRTSTVENHLEACGFEKNGSDFRGVQDSEPVFMTDEADTNVKDSGTKYWFLISGIVTLIFTLICCPLCTAFVYSATYEVSEAGTGATGGATSVGAV